MSVGLLWIFASKLFPLQESATICAFVVSSSWWGKRLQGNCLESVKLHFYTWQAFLWKSNIPETGNSVLERGRKERRERCHLILPTVKQWYVRSDQRLHPSEPQDTEPREREILTPAQRLYYSLLWHVNRHAHTNAHAIYLCIHLPADHWKALGCFPWSLWEAKSLRVDSLPKETYLGSTCYWILHTNGCNKGWAEHHHRNRYHTWPPTTYGKDFVSLCIKKKKKVYIAKTGISILLATMDYWMSNYRTSLSAHSLV